MLSGYKTMKPRGIRNNNPGNLENNGIDWLGLADSQTDPRFYRFSKPVYGIRAMARTLKTYYEKYGINTVEGIINRWAPSFENNTSAYASHVAHKLGVSVDDEIIVTAYIRPLIEAIIKHENGQQPYPQKLIEQGVALA